MISVISIKLNINYSLKVKNSKETFQVIVSCRCCNKKLIFCTPARFGLHFAQLHHTYHSSRTSWLSFCPVALDLEGLSQNIRVVSLFTAICLALGWSRQPILSTRTQQYIAVSGRLA